MNQSIAMKTIRDAAVMLYFIVPGIVLFEWLCITAMGSYFEESVSLLLKTPVINGMVSMLLGGELTGEATASAVMSMGFAHPLIWTLTWMFLLATITKTVGGEMECGTADLLLTLPVSRTRIYTSVSVVWVLAGWILMASIMVGVWTGEMLSPLWEPLDFGRFAVLLINLYCVYFAVGCGTMMVSSFIPRRGPAIGLVLAVLLFSFLLNFLGQFWEPATTFGFVGVLYYYQPLPVICGDGWPVLDMMVLMFAGVILWAIGLWQYVQRDVPAA